jgi:hypothetical protein
MREDFDMGTFDNWFNGWPFKSKEQREREDDAYRAQMFPLGVDTEMAAVKEVLSQLFSGEKKYDPEITLFMFLSSKQVYLDAQSSAAGKALVKDRLAQIGRWTGERAELMAAFVSLECRARSMEEFPTEEAVRAEAGV